MYSYRVSAPRIGFIVGPTAAGKSSLAIQLAEQLGAEIVNADSRQVYRGMDIGTAKPRAEELRRVPHHLIDIRDPDRPLNVAEFMLLARDAIAEITRRGRRVLVVGGSGLYLRAIRAGIFAAPPASPEIRAYLIALAADRGVVHLFVRLQAVDPDSAARIKPNDVKRVVRALEVYEQTGVPISRFRERHQFSEQPFETLTVGLTVSRAELYTTIERRFDNMIELGLVAEVQELLARGCELVLSTVGYREIARFVRGELSLAEAVARAKRASRLLAKRQLTWFRADSEIVWLNAADSANEALPLFEDFFSGRGATLRSIPASGAQHQLYPMRAAGDPKSMRTLTKGGQGGPASAD
jgi:tRNA dimethylallyltransferase